MDKKSIKIKAILADHWEAFVAEGYPIRSVVFKNVNKVITSGDPSIGHALYYCEHCNKFKPVAFTCKSRFCNSCGAKYTQDRAESISSKLIRCTHRHIVFTIPEELRIFFIRDRSLLHLLFKACADTIFNYFFKLNKSENFKPGFISTLHTFGRDLKWNPHIHALISKGGTGNITPWRPVKHFDYSFLRKVMTTTVKMSCFGTHFYFYKISNFCTNTICHINIVVSGRASSFAVTAVFA